MKVSFGSYLKATRKSLGLSQKEIAKVIGLSQTAYSFIETNRAKPYAHTVKKISVALNIPIEKIVKLLKEY